MKYGYFFLGFVDDLVMSLTVWINNTVVAFLFVGSFSFDIDTMWAVWVSNMSEVNLPVWIISCVDISIRVNYLQYVEDN